MSLLFRVWLREPRAFRDGWGLAFCLSATVKQSHWKAHGVGGDFILCRILGDTCIYTGVYHNEQGRSEKGLESEEWIARSVGDLKA